jgi:hypothetical protein
VGLGDSGSSILAYIHHYFSDVATLPGSEVGTPFHNISHNTRWISAQQPLVPFVLHLPSVQAWHGYKSSLAVTQSGPTLCLDAAVVAMPVTEDLLVWAAQVLSKYE